MVEKYFVITTYGCIVQGDGLTVHTRIYFNTNQAYPKLIKDNSFSIKPPEFEYFDNIFAMRNV
jgi:hypothetical protein